MSRGAMLRAIWAIWSAAWAVVWAWAASLAAPHPVCSQWLVVTTGNGPSCMAYGSSGSWLFSSLFAVAAALSAGSALLALRRG